jgi:hypothetical protein
MTLEPPSTMAMSLKGRFPGVRSCGDAWQGVVIVGFLALTGCGSLSPQTVAARKIGDALPQVIGPARHYAVQVEGNSFALSRGRARRIHVTGQDVQITPTATLDTLDITAQDVSFDTKAKRLDHVGRAEFTGTLGQEHLNSYLAQSGIHPGLAVTLRQSDLEVRLPISAGPIHTSVTVYGQAAPSTQGGSTINFVADRARVSILPVPVFLVNQALDQINPVVDLSHFKMPIALQSAVVQNQTLILQGTADLNSLTARNGPSS